MPSTGERLSGTRRSSALAAGHSKPPGGRHPIGQRHDDRGVLVGRGHILTRTRWAGARPRTATRTIEQLVGRPLGQTAAGFLGL